jgi:peptidoglycan/LPS O-acetylase OafA/YrhL
VLHHKTIQATVLECYPLRWIGRISYSLYLWQQLFWGVNVAGSPPGLNVLRQSPFNLLALMACATFSYYVVERPFVRLGHRLTTLAARSAFTKLAPAESARAGLVENSASFFAAASGETSGLDP